MIILKKILNNLDKLHTTALGYERLKKNLKLNVSNNNVIEYLKAIILDKNSIINRKGKNYYVENENIIITINSYSYTVITAHRK